MNNKKKLKCVAIMALFAIVFIVPILAHASTPSPSLGAGPTDPWQIFSKLIAPALAWVGAAMVIFGAVEMGFAFHAEEAEPKRKGLLVAMSGALLSVVCIGIQKVSVEVPKGTIEPGHVDNNEEMAKMLNQLGSWIPMLGFICMFWGVFELVKATKSDDAGGKQKALTIIMSGVCLWQLINLMKWVLGFK